MYGDTRLRTENHYNMHKLNRNLYSDDFWQMPIIKNDGIIPEKLTGFNYAKSSKNKNAAIHFYLDDYQFERVWNCPEKYIDILAKYKCIICPDFSLYTDMPLPMKAWNVYRSRWIGAFYQSKGLKVIPCISWAKEDTFDFCFRGVPEGSIISVSTVGCFRNKYAKKIWRAGMDELIKQIKPSTILIYGKPVDYDFKGVEVKYYNNEVSDNFNTYHKKGE